MKISKCGKRIILNQGGHSYHGAVQLYSIQLKCPRRVEKTEFRIALFQPARMQTLTSQMHNVTTADQLTRLLVLWVEILHARQEVFILLRNEVTLGGVSRLLGRTAVPHLRCRWTQG